MEDAPRKRILILGGGFAGLTVAMELEKRLTQDPAVEITLINRDGGTASPTRCAARSGSG